MRKLFCKSGAGIGFALLSPAMLATQEELLMTIGQVTMYAFILIMIVVFVAV